MLQAVLRDNPSVAACSSSATNPASARAARISPILERCRIFSFGRRRAGRGGRTLRDDGNPSRLFPRKEFRRRISSGPDCFFSQLCASCSHILVILRNHARCLREVALRAISVHSVANSRNSVEFIPLKRLAVALFRIISDYFGGIVQARSRRGFAPRRLTLRGRRPSSKRPWECKATPSLKKAAIWPSSNNQRERARGLHH